MKAIKLALGDLFNKGQFNCLHSKIFPCVIFEIMFPITESESIAKTYLLPISMKMRNHTLLGPLPLVFEL